MSAVEELQKSLNGLERIVLRVRDQRNNLLHAAKEAVHELQAFRGTLNGPGRADEILQNAINNAEERTT